MVNIMEDIKQSLNVSYEIFYVLIIIFVVVLVIFIFLCFIKKKFFNSIIGSNTRGFELKEINAASQK